VSAVTQAADNEVFGSPWPSRGAPNQTLVELFGTRTEAPPTKIKWATIPGFEELLAASPFIGQVQHVTGVPRHFLDVQRAIMRVLNARHWSHVRSLIESFKSRAVDWEAAAPEDSLIHVALMVAHNLEDLGLPWPQVYRDVEGDLVFTWRRLGSHVPAISISSDAILLFSLDPAAPVEATEFRPLSASDIARLGDDLRASLTATGVT